MDRFGPEAILAIAVAAWFVTAGLAKVVTKPVTGRRVLDTAPGWQLVVRRIRGVMEILGSLAVAAGGAISLLALRIPFPGVPLSVVLCGLAAWTVVDYVRTPIQGVRIALAVLGFALAVFFAGFRD